MAASGIINRLAIPSNPDEYFRIALQIGGLLLPLTWDGQALSYGGSMVDVPLALGGLVPRMSCSRVGLLRVVNLADISREYASPLENPDATFTPILSGSSLNETHWKTTTVCEGCSTWVKGGTEVALNASVTSVPFAAAYAAEAPVAPDDEASPITIHDGFVLWSWSLVEAQEERFEEVFDTPGNMTFR